MTGTDSASRRRRGLQAVLLALLSVVTGAGVAAPPVRFPPVTPDVRLRFPQDEGSHPAYRIEWWYVTGQVRDGAGREQGFQVTFFRVRTGLGENNPSRFAPTQVLFAHAAVADPRHRKLRHAERSARAGFGLAQAAEAVLDVRLDDWSLRQSGSNTYEARVVGADFAMNLQLRAAQPHLLQGDRGYSRKGPSPHAASYYYSQPQLAVQGSISIEGLSSAVSGRAWLDHEWSSDVIDPQSLGWDWMGINLDDGGALMAFRLRDAQGGARWAAATLRSPSGSSPGSSPGRVQTFTPADVVWLPLGQWRSPRTGHTYPVRWEVRVGTRRFRIEPWMDDAELDSRASTGTVYWEGPVRVTDAADGTPVGSGYLELTGYAGRMNL